jgi:TP901 family phage tail tape measure protein
LTDRIVRISLLAQVANYKANMEAARVQTEKNARTSVDAKAKFEAQNRAMSEVGRGLVTFGALAAVGVGLAIKTFADFDAQMSQVKSLSHATGDEMNQLRTAALHVGQAIGISASEAADAEIELVKAGVSVKDQLGGGLVGTLNLAAAGQLNVADATQIAASAMTQFQLQGKDVPAIADALAAGADKALGSVQDLGNGLKFVGPVAHSMGVSLNETVGTLALFAQNGILGEQAGTGLRGVLLSLTSPSKTASDVMKQYGINLYDAQGGFIGLAGTAEQLKKGLGGLNDADRNEALGRIFGNQQITEAALLMKAGAKDVKTWTAAVNDSGFAAQQAAGKMDNLNGDASKLAAAFQTDIIQSGSGANQTLRGLTQEATSLVTAFGNLPAPVLQGTLVVTALVAGVSLLGGTALITIPKIAAMRLAMTQMNITGKGLAGTLGKGGVVLLALTAVASAFANTGSSSSLAADELEKVDDVAKKLSARKLNELFDKTGSGIDLAGKKSEKLKDALDAVASSNFFQNESSQAKFIDGLTFGISHVSDVYKDNEAKFKELGVQLANTADTDLKTATNGFAGLVEQAGGGKEAIRQLLTVMPEYKAKLIGLASAQGITLTDAQLYNVAIGKGKIAQGLFATAAIESSAALADISDKANDATGDISKLADQIKGFASGTLDARSAERDFQQAVDDAEAAVKKNGKSLDVHTDKGRANQAGLDKIVTSTLASAAALSQQTGGQAKATAAVQRGREALIRQLGVLGITGDRAQRYADKLGLIPSQVGTVFKLTGLQKAERDLDLFEGKHRNKVINYTVSTTHVASDIPDRARGGILPGPPSSRDNMFVHAASGEYFVNAASTARNRAVLDYINSGGQVQGYATGGMVQPRYAQSAPTISAPVGWGTGASTSGTQPQINIVNPVVENLAESAAAAGQAFVASMGLN